jgi:hypothetical protein
MHGFDPEALRRARGSEVDIVLDTFMRNEDAVAMVIMDGPIETMKSELAEYGVALHKDRMGKWCLAPLDE